MLTDNVSRCRRNVFSNMLTSFTPDRTLSGLHHFSILSELVPAFPWNTRQLAIKSRQGLQGDEGDEADGDHLSDGGTATHGCSPARDGQETDRNGAEAADRRLSPHHPVHADWGHRFSDVNAAKQSGGRADAVRRSRNERCLQLSVWPDEGRGRSGR